MVIETWRAQWLREGYELAHGALVSLQHMDSPTLWRGPAATTFREDLAELASAVRSALGSARRAADGIEAAAAAAGGG